MYYISWDRTKICPMYCRPTCIGLAQNEEIGGIIAIWCIGGYGFGTCPFRGLVISMKGKCVGMVDAHETEYCWCEIHRIVICTNNLTRWSVCICGARVHRGESSVESESLFLDNKP